MGILRTRMIDALEKEGLEWTLGRQGADFC